MMKYRRLGKSGLKLSVFSFGSWITFKNQLDDSSAKDCMKLAYESGINFFDNAEAYAKGKSEEMMGQALKDFGWTRDSFCVSSKVFWGGDLPTQKGLSSKHVRDACDAALRRLQVDYLDLYYCHRPDPETPILETVQSMHNLVTQGKVLYWGTSEWSHDQVKLAYLYAEEYGLTPPTMEQPQYNMFVRDRVEKELFPHYEEFGLGTTVWSPLASGILTNKYADGIPKDSRANVEAYAWMKERFTSDEAKDQISKTKKIAGLAKEIGASSAQFSLAWCLRKPFVSTVILGASRVTQLEENLKALEFIKAFDASLDEKVEKILGNKPAESKT